MSETKKRRLTPAERIAALEAKLAAERERVIEKDIKARLELFDQLTKLDKRKQEIVAKISEVTVKFHAVDARIAAVRGSQDSLIPTLENEIDVDVESTVEDHEVWGNEPEPDEPFDSLTLDTV